MKSEGTKDQCLITAGEGEDRRHPTTAREARVSELGGFSAASAVPLVSSGTAVGSRGFDVASLPLRFIGAVIVDTSGLWSSNPPG